jgi:hypothetical protein
MFVALWGALLAAHALTYIFSQPMRLKHLAGTIAVIVLLTLPYIRSRPPSADVSVAGEIRAPNMGRGGANSAYILAPASMVETTWFHPDSNLASWDYNIADSSHHLFYPGIGVIPSPRRGDTLLITGNVPAEYLTSVRLTVRLDDTLIGNAMLQPGVFKLDLPITTEFPGDRVRIALQTDRYLDPDQRVAAAAKPGMLAFDIGELRIHSSTQRSGSSVLLDAEGLKKKRLIDRPDSYDLDTSQASVAQLPVFFYPNMMQVYDGDQPIRYGNLGRFVAIQLQPGRHLVTARFAGVGWANAISLLIWITMIVIGAWISVKDSMMRRSLRTFKWKAIGGS